MNDLCGVCRAPATGHVNVNLSAASSVPSDMQPRCADHMPATLGERVRRAVEHVALCDECAFVDGRWRACQQGRRLECAVEAAPEREG